MRRPEANLVNIAPMIGDLTETACRVIGDDQFAENYINELITDFERSLQGLNNSFSLGMNALKEAMGEQWRKLAPTQQHGLVHEFAAIKQKPYRSQREAAIDALYQQFLDESEETRDRRLSGRERYTLGPWGKFVCAKSTISTLGTFPDVYEDRRVRLPEILFVHNLDSRLRKGFAQTLGILKPGQSWDEFATGEKVTVVDTHDQVAKTVQADPASIPAFKISYPIKDKYVYLLGGKPNIFFNIGTPYEGVKAIFEIKPSFHLTDYSLLTDSSMEEALEADLVDSYLTLIINSPMLFSEK